MEAFVPQTLSGLFVEQMPLKKYYLFLKGLWWYTEVVLIWPFSKLMTKIEEPVVEHWGCKESQMGKQTNT